MANLEEFHVTVSDAGRAYTNGPWIGVHHAPCADSPDGWTYRGDIDTDPYTTLAWLVELAEKHTCPEDKI